MALLAFLTGVFFAVNLVVISHVGRREGPLRASFWNHAAGCLFLLAIVLVMTGERVLSVTAGTPWYAYFGGVLGAVFVAINSWVIPRLGAASAVLLVISGQALGGAFIDGFLHHLKSVPFSLLGMGLILAGMVVGVRKERPACDKKEDDVGAGSSIF